MPALCLVLRHIPSTGTLYGSERRNDNVILSTSLSNLLHGIPEIAT